MSSGNTHTFKALHNHQANSQKSQSKTKYKADLKKITAQLFKLESELIDINMKFSMPYREKRVKREIIKDQIEKLEADKQKLKLQFRKSLTRNAIIGGGKSKKSKRTRKNQTRKQKLTFMGFISNLM